MIDYRVVTRRIPYRIRHWVWSHIEALPYLAADIQDFVRGRRNPMIPPRAKSRIFGIDNNFELVGQEFLGHFKNLADLKPDEQVLEVGCGIGRMAVALTGYLNAVGHYCGFDISRSGINWCRKNITPRFPNFEFERADIYNKMYNPNGRYQAHEYRFPYDDDTFDFVFLTSVFTHMLPRDMEHYVSEIARVTKPEGRCLINYFLLNDQSLSSMQAGRSARQFIHDVEGCRVAVKDIPEEAVAYFEADVRDSFANSRLDIIEPIHYGLWDGRADGLSFQDIVVVRK